MGSILQRLAMAASLLPAFAQAAGNGWVSSGGEELKSRNNPWFIKNTRAIQICLDLDGAGFSLSRELSTRLVASSFDYWKHEFARRDPSLGIATQDIQISSEACTGNEDIEFRMGYGSLKSDERQYLSETSASLRSYVGVAVRKSYDPENLRGRGMILIASDKGAQRFQAERGSPEQFWSNEGLLLRTLIHELGHVFGLPHEIHGLMGERYPEECIRRFREGRADLRLSDNIPGFFERRDSVLLEKSEGSSPSFGGWNSYTPFFMTRQSGFLVLRNPNSSPGDELRGKIRSELRGRELEFPIQLYLPKEQKVFPDLSGDSFLVGPSRLRETLFVEFPDTDLKAVVSVSTNSVEMMLIGADKADRIKFRAGD
jgi:hypothetical protein